MIEITDKAVKHLKDFQEVEGEGLPVRIAIMSGASASPNLGVVCEEKTDNDEVIELDGLSVLIDKGLHTYCKNISVDYVQTDSGGCSVGGGFKIKPDNSL